MNFVLYNILDYLPNSDLILLNLALKYNINQNYFFISELKISLQEIIKNRNKLMKCFSRILEYKNLKSVFKYTIFDDDFIYDCPTYEYKGNFLGEDDFIDSIVPSDINFPIMIGFDYWKRPFIIIKYIFLGGDVIQFQLDYNFDINKDYLLVLFQRMSGFKNWWCKVNYNNGPLLIGKDTHVDNLDLIMTLDNIKLMIKNRKPYYVQYQNSILDEEVDFLELNCRLSY